MKKILFLFLFCVFKFSFAQKSINNYKYIIVPKQFEGFKKSDQYQTSSLLKFLFNKYNFTAYFDDETLPEDLARDKCSALLLSLKNKSGMFATKTQIELKDCFNTTVYTSKQGSSKLKEYKKAYHEAIRRSFKSIQALNYSYKPSTTVQQKKTIATEVSKPIVNQTKTTSLKTNSIVTGETLYAQPTDLGYQLVNSKPEIVFQILKTQYPDLYILKDANGMLIKKDNGFWDAQFYKDGKLMTKSYKIKF